MAKHKVVTGELQETARSGWGSFFLFVNFCMEFLGDGVNAADALVLVGG